MMTFGQLFDTRGIGGIVFLLALVLFACFYFGLWRWVLTGVVFSWRDRR